MSTNNRLYTTWMRIRNLCNKPSFPAFKHYGGRGIIICEEWDDFGTFCNWALDNGWDLSAPRGTCFIRRYDEDDDFCPDNCFVYWKKPR